MGTLNYGQHYVGSKFVSSKEIFTKASVISADNLDFSFGYLMTLHSRYYIFPPNHCNMSLYNTHSSEISLVNISILW